MRTRELADNYFSHASNQQKWGGYKKMKTQSLGKINFWNYFLIKKKMFKLYTSQNIVVNIRKYTLTIHIK